MANAILTIHFCFVLGVVLPIPLIALGKTLSWKWTRNFWFRSTHLAMICFVAVESTIGMVCPLTILEERFRSETGIGYEGGFIAYWFRRALYYDFEPIIFTVLYILVALLVLVLWRWAPPNRRKKRNLKP